MDDIAPAGIENQHRHRFPAWLTYFLIAVPLWAIVDFGTAGGFRASYLAGHGPVLLVFYVGYPLVFTYLVFRRRLTDRQLLVATLLAVFVIEVLVTRNALLTSLPSGLVLAPVAVGVYAPLTFFPLWIVRGEMARRKRVVTVLALLELLIIAATTFGSAAR